MQCYCYCLVPSGCGEAQCVCARASVCLCECLCECVCVGRGGGEGRSKGGQRARGQVEVEVGCGHSAAHACICTYAYAAPAQAGSRVSGLACTYLYSEGPGLSEAKAPVRPMPLCAVITWCCDRPKYLPAGVWVGVAAKPCRHTMTTATATMHMTHASSLPAPHALRRKWPSPLQAFAQGMQRHCWLTPS